VIPRRERGRAAAAAVRRSRKDTLCGGETPEVPDDWLVLNDPTGAKYIRGDVIPPEHPFKKTKIQIKPQ